MHDFVKISFEFGNYFLFLFCITKHRVMSTETDLSTIIFVIVFAYFNSPKLLEIENYYSVPTV
jgi:hypothetical protein